MVFSPQLASGQLSTAGGRHQGQNMLWLLGLLNMCVGCLFPATIYFVSHKIWCSSLPGLTRVSPETNVTPFPLRGIHMYCIPSIWMTEKWQLTRFKSSNHLPRFAQICLMIWIWGVWPEWRSRCAADTVAPSWLARASGHSNAAATHLRRFWMFDNQNRTEQRFDRLLSGAPLSCHKNASCLKRLLGSFPLWPGSNAWISWVQTC